MSQSASTGTTKAESRPFVKHIVSADGKSTEEFNVKALVNANNLSNISFNVPTPTAITGKNTNLRFANSGKKSWLANSKVVYPDGSTRTRMYIADVVVDCKRISPKVDYATVGIPAAIARKLLAAAQEQQGMTANFELFNKAVNDGYFWTTSKFDKLAHLSVLGTMDVGKLMEYRQQHVPTCFSGLHDSKITPMGLAVVQPNVKCYVPDSLNLEQALTQPWTVGFTMELFWMHENARVFSPSAIQTDAPAVIRIPKKISVAPELMEYLKSTQCLLE